MNHMIPSPIICNAYIIRSNSHQIKANYFTGPEIVPVAPISPGLILQPLTV